MTTTTAAAATTLDDADLVEQVVVAHVYCWLTPRPATLGVPGQFDHHRAYQHDVIRVMPAERDRGQALGGLADPADAAAGIREVEALSGPNATDDDLVAMGAGELIGYVTQNPGEAQRVYDIEAARRRPRPTVIRAAGFDPDTGLPVEPSPDPDAADGPTAVG